MADPKLQAAALRILADRVEDGARDLSPELASALAQELDRHPDDAEELGAIATAIDGESPAWHLAEVDRRRREDTGTRVEWSTLRDRLLAARRSA